MAPPPSKFNRAYDDKEAPPSSNLWVGNLSADTTDADLKELFGKFGALDKVTTYSSRSFAFVYFKRVEDAKAAKDALQGSDFRGNPIKIEFARPVRSNFCDLIIILLFCGFLYLYNNLFDTHVLRFFSNVLLPRRKVFHENYYFIRKTISVGKFRSDIC